MDHANEFSADSSRLAVGGDSVGGNMAAALCLMLRDRQGPKIDLQVLINPAPEDVAVHALKSTFFNDTFDFNRVDAMR